ncbi:hypothetical protein CA830_27975 [Burkholderia multivorans]|nr:hypothetical protein CA830_27975 [Burkholderia multivorans]
MNHHAWIRFTPIAVAAALALTACGGDDVQQQGLSAVKNVVVIYAENRSFDNLYGNFPGANGLQNVTAASAQQKDRNGQPLATLPKIWGGLTAKGVTPAVTEAMTENLPNAPFAIDDPNGFNTSMSVTTRDLYHRFYENQMQINGGKNDMFAAWADSGGLVMGHYTADASKLPLWKIAQQYTLADNFFMGAFGGSFLNHQYLICACAPYYANADKSPAAGSISAVNADGKSLQLASNSPASALAGAPKFVNSGNLTPDFYAVNTMQPPYQPSGNKAAAGGDPNLADPSAATTRLPSRSTFSGTSAAPTYTVTDETVAPPTTTAPQPYAAGTAIALGNGLSVPVSGTPSPNDTFSVTPAPQAGTDVFATLDTMIAALKVPIGSDTVAAAKLANAMTTGTTKLDNTMTNILTVQASVGGREQEIQAMQAVNQTNTLQVTSNLADLTSTNMVSTISQFLQMQNALTGAQKAYAQLQNLSLFQYINP